MRLAKSWNLVATEPILQGMTEPSGTSGNRRLWLLGLLVLTSAPPLVGQAGTVFVHDPAGRVELLADLAERGLADWSEYRLARRPTRYRVRSLSGGPVVEARSVAGNSGLVREVAMQAGRVREISWRWRIERSLRGNDREREKRGDDFAARVFVIFDASEGPWSGRALCYVWSAHQPLGTVYRSPFTDDVAMIVVASGDDRINTWVSHVRDPLEDYRRAFDAEPDTLAAVAIMVDTDNTRRQATANFDRLVLEVADRP